MSFPFYSSLSPRQRKLVLWTLAITFGTLAMIEIVRRVERSRNAGLADPRTGVSTDYIDDAIARQTPVRFTDVTAAAGLRLADAEPARHRLLPEDNGSGLAWGDFDADGWPDLFVVRHTGGSRLFRNQRDGTFADVTAAAGISRPGDWGMSASWVDYDGDGNLDLFVTSRGPNRLFRNRGNGTFEEVGARAGVDDPSWSAGAAWGDFDRDGAIDLYVCNYVTFDSGPESASEPVSSERGGYEAPYTINPSSYDAQPNRLYRNNGDGTFTDVTAACKVGNPDGRSLAATFCDLDGDGWLDLYVNNDVSRDRLYKNRGAEGTGKLPTFVDVSAVAGTADPRSSMGLSLAETGDLTGNQDGLPDLFVTHWVAEGNALYESRISPMGKLEYRDKARPLRLGELSLDHVGWGCGFADFDLDGRVDLAVGNGSTLEQEQNPVLLKPEAMWIFMNDGSGFRNVAPLAGDATVRAYNARGLAIADYDRDGKPDIALMTTEGMPVLLRNDSLTRHRGLAVVLRGPAAFMQGAKVEVSAGGKKQIRWQGGDVSYLSQHDNALIFGLGDGAGAESVVVHWVDGKTTKLEHVPAGRVAIEHPAAGVADGLPAGGQR